MFNKKTIILFLCFFTFSKITPIASGQIIDNLDELNGFKDFQIGDSFEKWKLQLQYVKESSEGYLVYRYLGSCCEKAFEFTVEDIQLAFNGNRLTKIIFYLENFKQHYNLTKSVFNQVGYNQLRSNFTTLFGLPTSETNPDRTSSISIMTTWLGKKVWLGTYYCFLGEIEGDYAFFIVQEQVERKTASEYFSEGYTMEKKGNYEGAMKNYNLALDINPNYQEVYLNRGVLKERLEDNFGAIQDYNRAVELNPKFTIAFMNRGIVKHRLKDYAGAMKDFNKVIELDPQNETAFYNRGNIKGLLDDYRGAILDYNNTIKLNPKHADAYLNRGVSKNILNDTTGACLDWSKAGELGNMQAYGLINRYCN